MILPSSGWLIVGVKSSLKVWESITVVGGTMSTGNYQFRFARGKIYVPLVSCDLGPKEMD
jgi:hypothetical protein